MEGQGTLGPDLPVTREENKGDEEKGDEKVGFLIGINNV
jgi:hypothetical protein